MPKKTQENFRKFDQQNGWKTANVTNITRENNNKKTITKFAQKKN